MTWLRALFGRARGQRILFAGVSLSALGKVSYTRCSLVREWRNLYNIISRLQKFIHSKKVSCGGVMRQANVKQIFSFFFLGSCLGNPVGKSGWNQNRLSILCSPRCMFIGAAIALTAQKTGSPALALSARLSVMSHPSTRAGLTARKTRKRRSFCGAEQFAHEVGRPRRWGTGLLNREVLIRSNARSTLGLCRG